MLDFWASPVYGSAGTVETSTVETSTQSFTDYLNGFTSGTLALVNSRNQITAALNSGDTAPVATRQDTPAQTTSTNLLMWGLIALIVYKVTR